MVRAHHVLADVDDPVGARDVGDDRVQALAAGQGRVDERARQVEAPPRDLEHPLDELAHLRCGEDRRGELGLAVPRDEHLLRGVDPDLLDVRVVESNLWAMTRAAIYTRISQDRTDGGLGVARQARDCAALANAKGWEVVATFEDNDTSATSGKPRPEYVRLISSVEAGEIDAVIVWDVDRLTRHPRELEDWIDFADRHGLSLASVGGEIDLATSQGRAMARMKGVFARMEAEQTSRRAKAKQAERAALGLPNGGGSRPFGFEADRVTHRPEEAATVRAAAARLLDGASMRSVCRWLNKDGLLTTTGRLWSTNTLKKMVTRPRIAGYREHLGELIDAQWDPILDRDVWLRLRAELNVDQRGAKRPQQRRHTWTGLLACWRCGGLLGARMVGERMSYSCRSSHHDRWDAHIRGGCQGTSIRLDETDAVLDDLLLSAVEQEDLGEADAETADPLLEQIAGLEERLEALASAFAHGTLSIDAFRAASNAISGDLGDARIRLSDQRRHARAIERLDPTTIRANWLTMPVAEKRALAQALIRKVTVGPARRGDNRFDPGRLSVEWL